VIGERAARAYRAARGSPPQEPTIIGNPQALEFLIEQIRQLLGDVYVMIEAIDVRSRKHPTFPERNRHPLMVLVERVQETAQQQWRGGVDLDIAAITELNMVVNLYRQFSRSRAWPIIRKNAKDRRNFIHDVIDLAFTAFTEDAHNGVALQENPAGGGRLADIRVAASSRGFLSVEVKTPDALQDPHLHLKPCRADAIIDGSFACADTGRGGQLGSAHPGLLVLGAFRLAPQVIEELERAAERKYDAWARAAAQTKQHIVGLAMLHFSHSCDEEIDPYPLLTSLQVVHPQPRIWNAAINVRFVYNPGYTGPIRPRYRPG
jgi:hypothetical protein